MGIPLLVSLLHSILMKSQAVGSYWLMALVAVSFSMGGKTLVSVLIVQFSFFSFAYQLAMLDKRLKGTRFYAIHSVSGINRVLSVGTILMAYLLATYSLYGISSMVISAL